MTSTDTPPPAAPSRAKSLTMRIVYGVLAVVFGVIALVKILTWNDLPGCDSTRAKDTLSNIFKEKKVEASRYDEINTVSKKDEEVLCTAKLTLKDNSRISINYKLFKENSEFLRGGSSARESPARSGRPRPPRTR